MKYLLILVCLVVCSCEPPRSRNTNVSTNTSTYTVTIPGTDVRYEHATLINDRTTYIEILTKEGKKVMINGPSSIIEE